MVLSALMVVSCVGSPRTRAHVGTSPALFNREVYRYTSAVGAATEARRYRVIVLQSSDGRLVRLLHRFNRHLKILVYENISFARANDPHAQSVCTPLPQDLRAHPGWFLKGVRGGRITAGADYLMDVGNRAYQRACIARGVGLARRYGFNGVFLDGVNAAIAYQVGPTARTVAAAYRTVPAWQRAMYSLLSRAARAAHAHRLLVIANIGGAVLTRNLWQRWNGPIDGAEEEAWTDGGAGPAQQLPWWRQKLQELAWSEAHGKYALMHSYSGTDAGNVYGLASMLLVAGGRASYSTSNVNYLGDERWYPEYQAAEHLGRPRGRYSRRGSGVYVRTFATGIVAVNPTRHGVGGVRLRGVYSGPGGARLRSVSLGAMSAVILLRAR